MHKKPTKKNKTQRLFPLWVIPVLALAAGMLTADRLGAEPRVAEFFSHIRPEWVQSVLSVELGTHNTDTVSIHTPGTVSVSDVAAAASLPEDMTTEQEADTEASSALVNESLFTPPSSVAEASSDEEAPTETTDGSPIKELTITKADGGGTGGIYISNQSGLSYNLKDMLNHPHTIAKNSSTDEPTVFILHTHATEAYVDSDGQRSQDTEKNVVHIGDVLAKTLESQGIGVVHCRKLIDVPSYNQSYNRAMGIIEAQMKETPSVKVILDVHRDSMITKSELQYKVVSEIDGKKCAQLMMVMGTNAGGLYHPNWRKNLNFAVNLQKQILAEYPTLMRPVNLRKQRFNEQATTGSMILECGTSANTISEVETSIKAFGKQLAQALS